MGCSESKEAPKKQQQPQQAKPQEGQRDAAGGEASTTAAKAPSPVTTTPAKNVEMPGIIDVPVDDPTLAKAHLNVDLFSNDKGFEATFDEGVQAYLALIEPSKYGDEEELPIYHDEAMDDTGFKLLFEKFMERGTGVLLAQHNQHLEYLLEKPYTPENISTWDQSQWTSKKKRAKEIWARRTTKTLVGAWFEAIGRREWFKANAKTPLDDGQGGAKFPLSARSAARARRKRVPSVRGAEVVIKKDTLVLVVKKVQNDHPSHSVYVYNATTGQQITLRCTFGEECKAVAGPNVTLEEDSSFRIVVMPQETLEYVNGNFPKGLTSMVATPVYGEIADADAMLSRAKTAEQSIVKNIQKLKDAVPSVEFGVQPMVDTPDNAGANSVVQACMANGIPFVDPYFPPLYNSLKTFGKAYPWKRPFQFLDGNRGTCSLENVIPSDIDEGGLGDGWLVCAIVILCERPLALLQPIFSLPAAFPTRRAEQYNGIYRLKICFEGWWREVIIDDYLPAIGKLPAFARSNNPSEMWPSYLEKAYAKLHGSYNAIKLGDTCDALADLTGLPVTKLSPEGTLYEETWPVLLDLVKRDGVLFFSTQGIDIAALSRSLDVVQSFAEVGLAPGYSFAVLQMMEVQIGNEVVELVQLRNQWGNVNEWTGDWSIKSHLWQKHPNIARSCKFSPDDDDVFWMQYSDCLRWFTSCAFLNIPKGDVTEVRWKGKVLHESGMLDFVVMLDVKAEGVVWVGVHQESGRSAENPEDPRKILAAVRFAVICEKKAAPGEMEVVKFNFESVVDGERDGVYSPNANISSSVHVSPGRYYIVASACNATEELEYNKTRPLTLSLLSPRSLGTATTLGTTVSMAESQDNVDFGGFLEVDPKPSLPAAMQLNGTTLPAPQYEVAL